ncbi:TPA: glycosyltransferase family 2 protein, partial [Patescibacteria group bacterium]|nr:glycosyltransferase family 2 protein [Patescibacteria group bacterium]
MLKKKTIAVVVPSYNEGKQIGKVIDTMPEFVDRIVIVNDKSTDDTEAVVKKYIENDKSEVRDLNHKKEIAPNGFNQAEIIAE